MTETEKTLARALNGCTFVPGIGVKRFARQMAEASKLEESPELTPKQRWYLVTSVVRFRRQIDPQTVTLAAKLVDELRARDD